jgi:serine/threonine protein kinase
MLAQSSKLSNPNAIWDLYKSHGAIASGRYGIVYKVECQTTRKTYAAKKLIKNRHDVSEQVNYRMIGNEVATMTSLTNKSHIVRIEHVLEDPEAVFLVMEYCAKGTLANYKQTISNPRVLKALLKNLLVGICQVHDAGFVHGDIKPWNIMISNIGRPKIGDFGQSQKCSNHSDGCYQKYGTPWYAAPELFEGCYGQAVDLWAFGVLAYELIYPEMHPILRRQECNNSKQTPTYVHDMLQKTDVVWPQTNNATIENIVNRQLIELINACLIKNKDKRIRACDALELDYFKK